VGIFRLEQQLLLEEEKQTFSYWEAVLLLSNKSQTNFGKTVN